MIKKSTMLMWAETGKSAKIRYTIQNDIRWKERLSKYPVTWKIVRKLYHYFQLNDIIDHTKCLECKLNEVSFESFNKGYKLFCSSICCNKSDYWKNSVKTSNLKKYGVESVMQLEHVKESLKLTLLERYGVDNYSKHPHFIEKFHKTCLEKYGVISPMHIEEFKNKQKDTFMQNYGVNSHNKANSIKNKKKETWLKTYGYDNPSKVPTIKIRKIKTMKLNGFIKSDEEKSLQQAYYDKVAQYTKENWLSYYYEINPNKLKRSFEEYHLDHIYSIIDGFNNNVSPEIIGHWTNLQLLPKMENIRKQRRSDKTLEQLLEDYGNKN